MQHSIDDIRNITLHGKVALSTVVVERVAPVVKDRKVRGLIGKLTRELWAWQLLEKQAGATLSEQEAMKLPSCVLYRKYTDALLVIPKDERENTVVRSANVLHGFVCWMIDGMERMLNPDKPFVLGADILDAGYSWLVEGMRLATLAAQAPETEYRWQRRAIDKLMRCHAVQGDDYHGSPLTADFFEDL